MPRVGEFAKLKYAHVERERRFLLQAVPEEVLPLPPRLVYDRYIYGTRLRLRLVEQQGKPPERKLGHKVAGHGTPAPIAHTSLYLDQAEYDALLALPAAELRKSRRPLWVGDMAFAVDDFHAPLDGLVTAEVDLGEDGEMTARVPWSSAVEITSDERFAGSALANTSSACLRRLLAEYA